MKARLNCNVIDKVCRHFNFGEGYADTWEVAVQRTDEEMDNSEYEPMYNTIYPLPDDFEVPEDFRKKMSNMTIVDIKEDGEWVKYLALTGCGMDMTWQICETYINLGFYPPTEHARLPAMGGEVYNKGKNLKTIRACNASLRMHRNWLNSRIADNKGLTKRGKV